MSDLSNLSCSELQAEISKRRQAKEKEIRDKYAIMETQIKQKYKDLKSYLKVDTDTINYIQQGFDLSFNESEYRYKMYQYQFDSHCQLSMDDVLQALLGNRAIYLPEDIINIAEQGALRSLKNAMLNEIAKLY